MNGEKKRVSNKMIVAWQRYYSEGIRSVSLFIGFLWR